MTNDGDPTGAPESSVTPYISVIGGKAAVDFYKRTFAAERRSATPPTTARFPLGG